MQRHTPSIRPQLFSAALTMLALGLAVLLAGCATRPSDAVDATRIVQARALLDDSAFAPTPQVAADASRLFAMTPAMQRYLRDTLQPQWRRHGVLQGLLAALQRDGQLRLEYEGGVTRTAAEAFEARAGNCLSLVAMTAAFATELGLQVKFHQVVDTDSWEHQGNLLVDQGHVNLSILQSVSPYLLQGSMAGWNETLIDFLPAQDLRHQLREPISATRVQAMYLNNRAVEALSSGQVDEAYAWVRASVQHDAAFAPALNTLAVLYLRQQRPAQALASLAQALRLTPDHEPALANRVLALRALGRPAEALAAQAQRETMASRSSLRHYQNALAALDRQAWPEARQHLTRALRLAPEHADLHLAMARAFAGLGQATPAARHLALAARHSTAPARQAQLHAKLERLRQAHPGVRADGG